MIKYFRLFLITIVLFTLTASPIIVLSQAEGEGEGEQETTVVEDGSLVNCTGEAGDNPCSFTLFFELIKKIVNYLVGISAVLATIVIVVAGIWYATDGGNGSRKKQADGMLKKGLGGFLFVLAAWLIIQTIILSLVSDTEFGTSLKNIFNK